MQAEGVQGAGRDLFLLFCSCENLTPFGGDRRVTAPSLGQTSHVSRLLVANVDGDRIDLRQLPE